MDKATFNQLPIQEQVAYINNELSKGSSLRAIQKNKGIPRSTVQSRFDKNGYVLVNNEYVKSNEMKTNVVQKEGLPKHIIEEPKQITLLEEKPVETIVVSENKNDNQDLIFRQEEIRILKELAKRELEKKDKSIILDLPNNGNIKTTIRVNADIWNDFLAFKKTSVHRQQDLISLAVKEFLDKYK